MKIQVGENQTSNLPVNKKAARLMQKNGKPALVTHLRFPLKRFIFLAY
jgi:hypothetical protein